MRIRYVDTPWTGYSKMSFAESDGLTFVNSGPADAVIDAVEYLIANPVDFSEVTRHNQHHFLVHVSRVLEKFKDDVANFLEDSQ